MIYDIHMHFGFIGLVLKGLIGDLLSFLVGRYYLADVGYTNMPGYMTPFRNTRYHINDFRGVELHRL